MMIENQKDIILQQKLNAVLHLLKKMVKYINMVQMLDKQKIHY